MGAARTLQDMFFEFSGKDSLATLTFVGAKMMRMTFAQLYDEAMRIARALVMHGLIPGTTVGVMAVNSAAWIQTFFGIIAAGCVVLPIDVQTEDDDLRRMLRIADCQLILADIDQADRRSHLPVEFASIGRFGAPVAPEVEMITIALTAKPQDVAVIVFTSGTTGVPKPVELTHANLISNVTALCAEKIIRPGDRALVPLPLHHIYPLTVGMLAVLASNAAIVLPAGLSGSELVKAMRDAEVTALLGVPRLYSALLASLRAVIVRRKGLAARLFPVLIASASFAQRRMGLRLGNILFRRVRTEIGPKLHLMVSGGAALPVEDERVLNVLGWQVLTGYGLTETSPILAFNRPACPRVGTVGQALSGVHLRIANPDFGGVGEIEATGVSVFSGYRKDEAATAMAFTPDGWFRTGDLGYLDADLYLHVTGRAAETIVLTNGKKIDPEALEVRYVSDPAIRELAILGGPTGLTALVVPDEEYLRENGAMRLYDRIASVLLARSRTFAPYLRLVGFAITLTPLPRTPLGKLRRHMLPPLYACASKNESTSPVTDDILPEDPRVVALWQWLRARYPGKQVRLTTSPQLELGLDSLGWVDLSLALHRDFGINLTEQQISRVVTVGDLMREATAAQADTPQDTAEDKSEAWLTPYGTGLQIARLAGEVLLKLTMRLAFRLQVNGLEHLPTPPFVICPNHVSYFDAFVLAAALPHRRLRKSYFAGWAGLLFATPLERLFSRAAQIIPIDPDREAGASIARAVSVLDCGNALIWFPEGRISPDGRLQPFQKGIGAVLERAPVPVVPAWIDGTVEILPPGRRLPRPRRVTVSFGPAINIELVGPVCAGRSRQSVIACAIHEAVVALAGDKRVLH